MPAIRPIGVSGSVPTVIQLAVGDLAINTYDGKAYIKKLVGTNQTIVELGTGGGSSVSASYALSSSYALNGGVTQIVAGTNITLSPTTGVGVVTVNAIAGGGGSGSPNGPLYSLQYNNGGLFSGSGNFTLLNNNELYLTGSLKVSGSITGSLFGTSSWSNNSISSSFARSASLAQSALTASYVLNAVSSSFASTASYSQNLVVSGSINNVDYIDFNTGSAVPAWKSGRVFWDNTDGALSVYNAEQDITLQVGQENWTRVSNRTGTTITNGTVVRLIGAHGDLPEVERAQSVIVSGSVNIQNQILGVATHDIEDNTKGFVTTQGLVRGLNTSIFSDGDTLFVGTGSAGVLQNTPPAAPYEIIPVGVCVKSGPGGSGIIYVAVQEPLDFSDLSSVLTAGSYHYGDIWTYVPSGSTGVWTHTDQLSGSYGLTGSLSATSFTGSLFGTASHAVASLSASYAPDTTFPYVGTARISGSLIVSGSIIISSSATFTNIGPAIFSGSVTGTSGFTGSLQGTSSWAGSSVNASTASYVQTAQTASYVLNAVSSSFTVTASFVRNAVSASYVPSTVSASFASTASFVNILNQNVVITSSLTVGYTTTGINENTLTLGPAPGGGTGEGGQLGLNATGGSYTSASFLDTWQDQFRVLRGSNTGGSNAGLMYVNLQTGNTQFVGSVTASAYSGLPNAYFYATRNTNQTIGGGTWANRDVVFSNLIYTNGISYDAGSGVATLTGGKVYRITARVAWASLGSYTFEISCYDTVNTQLGPIAQQLAPGNGSFNSSDGTLDFIYAPVSDTGVKIRTSPNTTALSGEYIRGDLNTQFIIQQIA